MFSRAGVRQKRLVASTSRKNVGRVALRKKTVDGAVAYKSVSGAPNRRPEADLHALIRQQHGVWTGES